MTDLKEKEMKNLLLETFYFRTTVKKNGKVVAFVFTFQKETVPNKKSFL